MPVVQLTAELSSEQLLRAVTQLPQNEFTKFLKQITALHPPKEDYRLSREESELLLKINQGIPEKTRQRYHELIEKRQDETLVPDEYEELLVLTDQIETCDAKRIEYLADLAHIRNIPLTVLMDELGIHPPEYA